MLNMSAHAFHCETLELQLLITIPADDHGAFQSHAMSNISNSTSNCSSRGQEKGQENSLYFYSSYPNNLLLEWNPGGRIYLAV